MRQRHRMRRAVFLFAAIAAAQAPTPTIYELGTTPKPKAEDYDVHAKAGEFEIGAEFMGHSFSGGEAMYIARDYLTVEVGLYPAKDTSGKAKPFDVNLGEFWLSNEHIRRLQVSMNDALLVGRVQRLANLHRVFQRLIGRHWALDRSAIDILHHQVIWANVVKRADMGMVQRGDRARFTAEAFGKLFA